MEFISAITPIIRKKYFSSPSRGNRKTIPIIKNIRAKPTFDSTFANINSPAQKKHFFYKFIK